MAHRSPLCRRSSRASCRPPSAPHTAARWQTRKRRSPGASPGYSGRGREGRGVCHAEWIQAWERCVPRATQASYTPHKACLHARTHPFVAKTTTSANNHARRTKTEATLGDSPHLGQVLAILPRVHIAVWERVDAVAVALAAQVLADVVRVVRALWGRGERGGARSVLGRGGGVKWPAGQPGGVVAAASPTHPTLPRPTPPARRRLSLPLSLPAGDPPSRGPLAPAS